MSTDVQVFRKEQIRFNNYRVKQKYNRKIFSIITLAILLIIHFIGCFEEDKIERKVIPSSPNISLNGNDELYIIWTEFKDNDIDFSRYNYKRKLTVLDSDGMIKKKSGSLNDFPNNLISSNFLIDSENNIQMVSVEEHHVGTFKKYSISYIKYDLESNPIINKKVLTELENGTNNPEIDISKKDVINIVWQKDFSPTNNFFLLQIDTSGNKISDEIMIINETECLYDYPLIICDSNDSIHIRWNKINSNNYYKKLTENGSVSIDAIPLNMISVVPNYPVIKDDLGRFLYLDKDGVADSDNNVHIFNQYMSKERKGQHSLVYNKIDRTGSILIENRTIYESTDYMHTPRIKIDSVNDIHIVWKEGDHIYYIKLDNNGNKLIEKMKIV